MAMVISNRAKAIIFGMLCFMLLGAVLVAGSTKGWFAVQGFNGEHVAARIQVNNKANMHPKPECNKNK